MKTRQVTPADPVERGFRVEVAHEFDVAVDAEARLEEVVRILLGDPPGERQGGIAA